MKTLQLHHGDCLEVLKTMPDCSVDSIVTDPPYGLSFMGKKWDYDVPSVDVWAQCLRVLKPGGHLLAFAGTRTQHRMAVRIEDAGFEIRDMIAWVYSTGFPKSLDVSKAIDRAAGAERDVTREGQTKAPEDAGKFDSAPSAARERRDNPATDAARQWQGWGTALKPALEPITVARKPLGTGTVAANVLEHGTGALNIDGCRVAATDKTPAPVGVFVGSAIGPTGLRGERDGSADNLGRWPANLIHDGSDEVLSAFPQASGAVAPVKGTEASAKTANAFGEFAGRTPSDRRDGGGSAARFFYAAKASKRDREEGLDGFDRVATGAMDGNSGRSGQRTAGDGVTPIEKPVRANTHPTVKPTDLMAYLCRLVTPPGGVVLDPFMGSGSTGKAAVLEGFGFIGIEREAEYIAIARSRIDAASRQGLLL